MNTMILEALVNFYIPLLVGIIYGKVFSPNEKVRREFSRIILYIFLPPLLFNSVYKRSTGLGLGSLFIVTIIAILLVIILLPISYLVFKGVPEFIMTSIYANAGYLPIPIAALIWGNDAISLIGFYVLGANTASNIIIPIISSKSGVRGGLERLKRYPPIYAILLGLILGIISFKIPTLFQNPIDILGNIAPTLALTVLGLEASTMKNLDRDGVKIFIFRQVASIAIGLILIHIFFEDLSSLTGKVILLEAAMPPAVTNLILAHEYNLNASKVAKIVLTATFLTTVLTIPLLLFLFTLL